MLQRTLPAVIGDIASSVSNLTNQLVTPDQSGFAATQPISPSGLMAASPDESLPVLVLMTKDMKPSSLARFQQYGKTLVWVEAMKNIPFAQLDPCVYLLIDYRLDDARTQLAKEDLTKWNVVHYVSWIQRVEEYLESIPGNIITTIPKQTISKLDFDTRLVNQPLIPPSLIKSAFKRLMYCWTN